MAEDKITITSKSDSYGMRDVVTYTDREGDKFVVTEKHWMAPFQGEGRSVAYELDDPQGHKRTLSPEEGKALRHQLDESFLSQDLVARVSENLQGLTSGKVVYDAHQSIAGMDAEVQHNLPCAAQSASAAKAR